MRDPETQLFEALAAWVRRRYPSRRAVKILIVLDDGDRALLPAPKPWELRDDESPPAADERQCAADIEATLAEVGHRLTTTQLLQALEARDRLWGESTVRGHLAQMVRDGRLTNDAQARPHRGYGLPSW